ILSRELAHRGHYPAINVPESVSRVMDTIIDPEHIRAARKLREVLATYEKERDLILIGAYQKGSDARVDYAISKIDEVHTFLKQDVDEKITYAETVDWLLRMFP